MLPDELLALVDELLRPLGARAEPGEEFERPSLDVLAYHHRLVRVGAIPVLGRCLSVVAVARQPLDLGAAAALEQQGRIARAVESRFPPWPKGRGASLALTTILLTPEPIRPEDDDLLAKSLRRPKRSRVVPLGIFRLNLVQPAMAHALTGTPDQLFPEPEILADAFATRFRRFLPPIDFD